MSDLLTFDREHLWHPYTSMIDPLPVVEVVSAAGVRLFLEDGRELIDGMSSWWAVIHGYNHPSLLHALKSQADQLCHVMFGGITHRPAVELGKKLVEMTPAPLDRVFLCDSGSVAVEVAMKMALQFWHGKGESQRKKFLTIRSGYHGDTFHAMSVCDPHTGMHQIYTGVLPENLFAPRPEITFYQEWDETDILAFEEKLRKDEKEICAVILEPIVQGAGGMRFYHPEYLRRVRALCDRTGILLICDEIATGFGRSGELFGCDHSQISPDIMCLGKALTGGYMTLAAVMATGRVADGISSREPFVFMHGPTFMGNPLACSVAVASLDLLLQSEWREKVKRIEKELVDGLNPCNDLDGVADVRVLGAIGVVELHEPVDVVDAQKLFIDAGIWVRPFGKLVYLMPPFVITKEEMSTLTRAFVSVLEKLLK